MWVSLSPTAILNSRFEIIAEFSHVSRSVTIAETWMLDGSTIREYTGAMLGSIDDVISTLGGTAKVASLCGVGQSAVSNWKFRGRIPAEKFLIFADALDKLNTRADPALFGFETAEPVQ